MWWPFNCARASSRSPTTIANAIKTLSADALVQIAELIKRTELAAYARTDVARLSGPVSNSFATEVSVLRVVRRRCWMTWNVDRRHRQANKEESAHADAIGVTVMAAAASAAIAPEAPPPPAPDEQSEVFSDCLLCAHSAGPHCAAIAPGTCRHSTPSDWIR